MMMNFLISQLSREPCPWLTGRAASHTPPITWSATTASTLPPGVGVLITLLDKYSHFIAPSSPGPGGTSRVRLPGGESRRSSWLWWRGPPCCRGLSGSSVMIIITNHHHYHYNHTVDTGGLCVAGLHMVGQMRRATGEAASSMYDQLTDTVSDRWAVT